MFIAGVDEAGRGPALGPMVLAVVLASKEQEEALKELKVKDSKLLKKSEREYLEKKIKETVEDYAIAIVHPKELDGLMDRRSLNEIEAMKIGAMLNSLKQKPEVLIADSPDLIEQNFAKRIKKYFCEPILIRAEHFADKNHAVVSAASIIAKVARDREIEKLKQEFGDIGSGYSHDPKTREFIEKYIENNNCLPSCARKNWQTSMNALDKKFQKRLEEY